MPTVKPYAQEPLVRPTSTLATVGFILSLSVIGFLPGIVLGILALRTTRSGERGGNALAVAAIVIGAFSLLWVLAWLIFGVTVVNQFQDSDADPATYAL